MESKWVFMLITLGLLCLLGLTIANMEKTSVMNNWTDRRCELPIMVAASFFKPDSDPRTASDFSKDNFEFCMKTTVEKFIAFFMGPVNALFGKQVNAAGDAVNVVNTVRSIAQTLYNTFMSYIDILFRKFNDSVFEMSRVIQHLRMAMNRLSAIAVSMIYAGISMFRSMTNAIQLVIRVIFIICAIMLAIIIILWFILFPFIPIILATLGAIVTAVMVFSGILSDSISSDAQNKMGGFCFAEDTPIVVQTADGTEKTVPASELRLGDQLAHGGGRVTTVIVMNGEQIPLYELHGVYVSGSHLVKGVDGIWKSVAEDERSKCTTRISQKIYCFNTTSNTIPIQSDDGAVIWFRDWEEIDHDDDNGQYMWNYMISTILNCYSNHKAWKQNMIPYCEDAVFGKDVRVKTRDGFIPIHELILRPEVRVLDRLGDEYDVVGTVCGEVENADDTDGQWHTDMYVFENELWLKQKRTVKRGTDTITGFTLITESGEFIIWDEKEKKEKVVRDFTEVGYQTIHETYSFIEARLRTRKNI